MKLSVVAAAGLFAVALGTKPKKCSKNCFNAIVSDTPANLGEAFCSSFLSLQPLEAATTTITVVRDEIVTTTNTNSETTTTTVTTTDATITTTTATVNAVLTKRAQTLVDPSSSILSACKTKSALISSICSHLLPAATTAPASTVTVEQTSTSTAVVEFTTITVETATDTATATEYAVATAQATPFANNNFQGDISPWTTSGSGVEHLKKFALCVGPACTQTDMIRVTPPGLGHIAISQTFDAVPLTTYKVTLYLNIPSGTVPNSLGIQMTYNNVALGTYPVMSATTGQPYQILSIWEYTTDASGKGTLSVLVNSSTPYPGFIYIYIVRPDKKEPASG